MNVVSIFFDIDNPDEVVNKYNSTYHVTIRMKSFDVMSGTCIEFCAENNKKDPKFKFGNHERVSNYKNIFAKGYTANRSEEIFVIKKLKKIYHGHVLLVIGKEIVKNFYEKNCKKQTKKNSGLKIIQKKDHKLFVECKGYKNLFNNLIDLEGIV